MVRVITAYAIRMVLLSLVAATAVNADPGANRLTNARSAKQTARGDSEEATHTGPDRTRTSSLSALPNSRPVDVSGNLLQGVFDDVVVEGAGIDVLADQSETGVFEMDADGDLSSFAVEIAAAPGTNRIGIYDFAEPHKKVRLFDGDNIAGDQRTVRFDLDGKVYITGNSPFTTFQMFGDRVRFGFYLERVQPGTGRVLDTFYSEDRRNTDEGARVLAYSGRDENEIQFGAMPRTPFQSQEWIIAFDDTEIGGDPEHCDFAEAVLFVGPINAVRLTCGNNTLDPGEECDDGNNVDHDGCDANCELEGACCYPEGQCRDNAIELVCEFVGGRYQGDSVSCNDVYCPVCGDGQVESDEECDDGNNVSGDGCDKNCLREGACCFEQVNECVDHYDVDVCIGFGGVYRGDGVMCETINCQPNIEACCHSNGVCTDEPRESCFNHGGAPQGPNTNCNSADCSAPEACCFPGGGCTQLLASDCKQAGGQPFGHVECADIDCPELPEACCVPDDGCLMLPASACFAEGWLPQGLGTDCATVDCPDVRGACCLPTGGCTIMPADECGAAGGSFGGPKSTCDQINCPPPLEACCLQGGGCQMMPTDVCVNTAGLPQGPGSTCDSVHCPLPPEACCKNDGDCLMLPVILCEGSGWTPQGPGSDCSNVECPAPPQACCRSNGTCVMERPAICLLNGWSVQPPGVICNDLPCPLPPEACCLPGGDCIMLPREPCFDQGGFPQGPDSICDDVDCPSDECQPATSGLVCEPQGCPIPGINCRPRRIQCTPDGDCVIVECDCTDVDECHIEMGQSGQLPVCLGTCPDGQHCRQNETDTNGDGIADLFECECVNNECEPSESGFGCAPFDCPDPDQDCVPTLVECDAAGGCHVIACDCQDDDDCHPEVSPNGPFCVGECPPGELCVEVHDGNLFSCECETIECEPIETGFGCEPALCPDDDEHCVPTRVVCIPGAPCFVVECDCRNDDRCHVEFSIVDGPVCVGECPPGQVCNQIRTTHDDGSIEITCECEVVECEPTPNLDRCNPFDCPEPNQECIPTAVVCIGGVCVIDACDCRDRDRCHVELTTAGPTCVGECPPGMECVEVWDGSRFECTCEPIECEVDAALQYCTPALCPDPNQNCLPTRVECDATGQCAVVDCDCRGTDECHPEITDVAGPICVGQCPPGQVCSEVRTVHADGSFALECVCEDEECEPDSTGLGCEPFDCPTGQDCIPTVVSCNPNGVCVVAECDCRDDDVCHIAIDANPPFGTYCKGVCPPGTECVEVRHVNDVPGMNELRECICEPIDCEPIDTGLECDWVECPEDNQKCRPSKIICDPNGVCTLLECDCTSVDECHIELGQPGGPPAICLGTCPPGEVCEQSHTTLDDGSVIIECRCEPTMDECEPTPIGDGCEPFDCPPDQECVPTLLHCDPNGFCVVAECECQDNDICHPEPTPSGPVCEGLCPPGAVCIPNWGTDGLFRCDCQTIECEPDPHGPGCIPIQCPEDNEECIPTYVECDPTGQCHVVECDCRDRNDCHVELTTAGETFCVGECPPGQICTEIRTPLANGGQRIECVCEEPECGPDDSGLGCQPAPCPFDNQECVPTRVQCVPGGPCVVVDCDCRQIDECHVEFDAAGNFDCAGYCPTGEICRQDVHTNANGIVVISCDCIPDLPCAPNDSGTACNPTDCPDDDEECVPVAAECDANGQCIILDCECEENDICHIELDTTSPDGTTCVGECPPGTDCVKKRFDFDGDGFAERIECACEPVICEPEETLERCRKIDCPDPNDKCVPIKVHCDPSWGCVVLECECAPPDQCRVFRSDGIPPSCVGYCPPGLHCTEEWTDEDGDGMDDTLACGCGELDCAPKPNGDACNPVDCPDPNEQCIPQALYCPPGGACVVTECDCDSTEKCHPVINPTGGPPTCEGVCPDGTRCRGIRTDHDGDGHHERFECICEPIDCEPTHIGDACEPHDCADPDEECIPTAYECDRDGHCVVVDCECGLRDECHPVRLPGVAFPVCEGRCPPGEECERRETDLDGDGFAELFTCDCVPTECEPDVDGFGCIPVECPDPNQQCIPTLVSCPPNERCVVLECECRPTEECHVVIDASASRATCEGLCPIGEQCRRSKLDTDGDGILDLFDCGCVQADCRPTDDGDACEPYDCPNQDYACTPTAVHYDPATGDSRVVECDCKDEGRCRVEFNPGTEPFCVGECPPGTDCTRDVSPVGTDPADGLIVTCKCVPIPTCEPVPTPVGLRCPADTCPGMNERCLPTTVHCDHTGFCEVVDCDCDSDFVCRISLDLNGEPVCTGGCPSGEVCHRIAEDTDGNGTADLFHCDCEPPGPQACCLPTGQCLEISEDECLALKAHPAGPGFSCDNIDCPQPEACCLPNGMCAEMLHDRCLDAGGVPGGEGSDCVDTVCIHKEACCFDDGDCLDLTESACLQNGGIPQGPNTDCSLHTCPRPQACCFASGDCVEMQPDRCAQEGGFPQGADSECATTECEPTLACCLPGGECLDLAKRDCLEHGGLPLVANSTCAFAHCPLPDEACCLPEDKCEDLPPSACILENGTPQGPGSFCDDDPCPAIPHIVSSLPCSGYIDPRAESKNGLSPTLGVHTLTLMFNVPVFSPAGGPVGPADFLVFETGPGAAPSVVSVDATANPEIVVEFDRIITLREWTTVQAVVESAAGSPITNLGDLGPLDEPDRVDIAFLPGDVTQNGAATPLDTLRARQYQMNNCMNCPDCGPPELYFDTDRNNAITPIDLIRTMQLLRGTLPPSTEVWNGKTLNHARP